MYSQGDALYPYCTAAAAAADVAADVGVDVVERLQTSMTTASDEQG